MPASSGAACPSRCGRAACAADRRRVVPPGPPPGSGVEVFRDRFAPRSWGRFDSGAGPAGDTTPGLAGPRSSVEVGLGRDRVTVTDGTGRPLADEPRAGGPDELDLLLDGGVLQLVAGGVEGLATCRSGLDPAPVELTVRGPAGATVTAEEVTSASTP